MTFKKHRNVLNAQLNLLISKIKNDRPCYKDQVFPHTAYCLALSTPGLWSASQCRRIELCWVKSWYFIPGITYPSCPRLKSIPSSKSSRSEILLFCDVIRTLIVAGTLMIHVLSQLKPLIFNISQHASCHYFSLQKYMEILNDSLSLQCSSLRVF